MSVLPMLETSASQGCCPPLSARALDPQVAGELAPLFKALSDPIRLRLLSLIAASDEVCVCDLTDAFDVTGATISHHLRVLREAGMVEARRVGTWAYYRLRAEALDLLGGLLSTGSAASSRLPAPSVTALPAADHGSQGPAISANPDVVRLLGDPLRAQIVQILAEGPATTSHLVADTGAKQPNVSGHLKLLREAGVVSAESRGRYTYYRIVPDALQGAALHLADLAAQARATADEFRSL
ncbi:metalloregulator ArsR/SmtB family transcription factor [Actinoplanes sp. NPDC049316]|uniref:ArsR/SmtB family transcription factor n=1 Tax=Actinoplanes sp. NPDC049316 TaxID=3154727 RepID=UPI00341DA248